MRNSYFVCDIGPRNNSVVLLEKNIIDLLTFYLLSPIDLIIIAHIKNEQQLAFHEMSRFFKVFFSVGEKKKTVH